MTRVPLVALVFGALGAVACERTPPEDVASRSATLASAASAQAPLPSPIPPTADTSGSAPPGRCILPSPPTPPQSVPPGSAVRCPADPEGPSQPPALAHVTFPDTSDAAVEAEVVRSQHDTMRGLMFRTSLAENRAMLFDLRVRDDHKFWMHNTCISLDLLYVDEDGLIVGIVENAPTLNDEARGVGCPSVYVLEVNAGWARRHGVRAGQHMRISPPGGAAK